MEWKLLETEEQLEELIHQSFQKPQLIFKHSTRCSVSGMIKNRLEKKEAPDTVDFHYLDLIAYRALSNKIADKFNIAHQSPQVLLIKEGNAVFTESHNAIYMEDILDLA